MPSGNYERRVRNFASHAKHPLRCADFARLNKEELSWVNCFIKQHAGMSTDEYAMLLHRMVIADLSIRKKNRTRVWGLLLEAMSMEIDHKKYKHRRKHVERN